MIRLPTIIVAAMAVVASGVLFRISYDVQALEEQLKAHNRQILQEQESIRVLRAEWAYLNQPSRLRQLATQYSSLAPVKPSQIIASIEEIPMPLPGAPQMPGYPVPGRKPGSPAPESSPALIADEEGPGIVEAPGAASAEVVTGASMLQTAALPASTESTVDVVLASFRRQQSGQEAAQ